LLFLLPKFVDEKGKKTYKRISNQVRNFWWECGHSQAEKVVILLNYYLFFNFFQGKTFGGVRKSKKMLRSAIKPIMRTVCL
jgi:hypothetical protein